MIGPPRSAAAYPFARLQALRDRAAATDYSVIDFGVGDPQDPTPAFIRQALIEAIPEVSSYPRAAGLPALQEAITNWINNRFEIDIDSVGVLPTLGSKEMIHDLAPYVLTEERNVVLVPTPAYPVYERGANFHGAEVVELPLTAESDFLPDLESIAPEVLARTALLWLNYPNNPTGATAPLAFYEEVVALAHRHGFVVASDEAYSEIWFDAPPASILQCNDLRDVVALNTLSKRSCMTGYRSGFIAGDPNLVERIRVYRASTGTTPPDFVQLASIAAWNDELHVADQLALWTAKRSRLLGTLHELGIRAISAATFFLWITVPNGYDSYRFAELLADVGIVVSPGTVFGDAGEGYVRLALVPSLDHCIEAADRLSRHPLLQDLDKDFL